jgi:hypothetical protein
VRPVAFALAIRVACVTSALLAAGCNHPVVPLHEPSSVESLCLAGPPVHQKGYKLPSIDALRNDRLIKGQDLHVDLEASRRVVAGTARALPGAPIDESAARTFIIENGGGVFIWWRAAPVSIVYQPADPKAASVRADVYGAAIAETPPQRLGRMLYLFARPAGTASPRWRAFESGDREHVCL